MATERSAPTSAPPTQDRRHGTRLDHDTKLKSGSVGVLGIMFFVLSAQAPLTGVVGPTPITIGLGNGAGAPAASLLVGLVIALFAVGFIEMSRRVNAHGAFYAYIGEALGARVGVGSAWLAILAYGAIQGGMYGLYGSISSGLLGSWFGLEVPWWAIVVVTIAVVLVLGSRNIELGSRILSVLVIAEFILIGLFCAAVFFSGGGPEGLDLATSFSPRVVLTGAPGVAVMFAVASMVGFESVAIYSEEAKDPVRTIPRATYLSIAVVALFYAFAIWLIVSYYGPSTVVDQARSALTGDTSAFVINAMADELGGWAAHTAGVLLVTSLLAGVIAFHNGVNRYLHSLGTRHALPRALARVNRHKAPANAARLQSVLALITVIPFAVSGQDPAVTLFSWGGGIAVLSLLVLYVFCSAAVIRYFVGNPTGASVLRTRLAPTLAMLLLIGLLVLVVRNFPVLVGSGGALAWGLMALVPAAFVGGFASTLIFPMDGPVELRPGPNRHLDPPQTLTSERPS